MTSTLWAGALAIVLAGASLPLQASETADLVVGGNIRPAACEISLSDNGNVDFGSISASTLSSIAPTHLPTRTLTLSIQCDAPTYVGITTIDNRSGTANETAGDSLDVTDSSSYFGVGAVDGKNIGAYAIVGGPRYALHPTADGMAVHLLYSDNGGSWEVAIYGDASAIRHRTQAWGDLDTRTPGAYQAIMQPLQVLLAIGMTTELPDLTNVIPIDGSTTISLVYL